MKIIPCEQDPILRRKVELFAEILKTAVSNLKCNTRPLDFIVEHFLGSSESEACAWPRVEAGGDFFEIAV